MPGPTFNACNMEVQDDAEQKLHYKSDWCRFNLKRKLEFRGLLRRCSWQDSQCLPRRMAKSTETPDAVQLVVCVGRGHRSAKANAQHLLNSRSHIVRASQGIMSQEDDEAVSSIIKPLQRRAVDRHLQTRGKEMEESEDEWEQVGSEDEDMVGDLDGNEAAANDDLDVEGDEYLLDPSSCFMGNQDHNGNERLHGSHAQAAWILYS